MQESTAAAVRALVKALEAHHDDLLDLTAYGNRPQHLID